MYNFKLLGYENYLMHSRSAEHLVSLYIHPRNFKNLLTNHISTCGTQPLHIVVDKLLHTEQDATVARGFTDELLENLLTLVTLLIGWISHIM